MFYVCTVLDKDTPSVLKEGEYRVMKDEGKVLSLLEEFEDFVDAKTFRDEIIVELNQINEDSKHDMEKYKP
jgi:hypothetical protein